MNFKNQESSTKLRGGYYTPLPVAEFLSKWVLKTRPQRVLEPSCGDGVFIAALRRLADDGLHFCGVELDPGEAAKSRAAAAQAERLTAEVHNADFLEWALEELDRGTEFDAILGNPPYIRYQYLEPQDQALAERLFRRYQLPFTKHTNAWVPFVIASLGLLAPGGRIAMVIPSEILHVLHAASLRALMLADCDRVVLIDPTELLFDQALQGTMLLMAEKKRVPEAPTKGLAILSAPDNRFLGGDPDALLSQASFVVGHVLNGKWMKALLTGSELQILESARQHPQVQVFRNVATVDVGIVTGANKFFLVDEATVAEYNLEPYTHPMFGRSEHCPGVIYDEAVHRQNREKGLPVNFVMLGNTPFDQLNEGAQRYVRHGEQQEIHRRYKCRIRSPWYDIPSVYATEVGMLKRSHNYPRLIFNKARAYTTDTAYRIRTTRPSMQAEDLVYAFVNSLTALTAELEGRHYGGGVLELVPSEIEKLLIPVVSGGRDRLPALDRQVRANIGPDDLMLQQDEVILRAAGFTPAEAAVIRGAWSRMRDRRKRNPAVAED